MAAIVVVGATFRLTDLDNRLVHCDEANQAVKFGILLEGGRYDYDPREHHGPSLSLFTLPIARLNAVDKLTELTETHLRLAPAVFGIVLIGFVWLLRDALGMAAALWAGLLTAVSPAMVFYSRYYIQEMLLVCFTFAAIVALGRCAKHFAPVENEQPTSPRRSRIQRACWAVLLGLSVGLMHSAKETCVIALFAMAVAAVIALPDLRRAGFRRLLLFGLIVATTAAASSALMFSGFLADAEDVRESYTTYATYFDRAGGEGSAGPHDYPWHHYFQRLFWWNRGQSHVWTEASIAALALVGLVAGAWGKGLMPAWVPMTRFLCIYTVLMTAIYCAIPYKTPWCALGFLHGMILLGGVGATVLIRAMPHWTARAAMGLLILAAAGHLGWQAHRAGFVEYREPDNPYFYAHTTADVPRLARRMQRIAAAHADGRSMHIQVLSPEHNYWPLPWYLRRLDHVEFSDKIPPQPPAPLIVIMPNMAESLRKYLFVDPPPGRRLGYVPVSNDDRPGWELYKNVFLYAFVQHVLNERVEAKAGEVPLPGDGKLLGK